MPRIKLPSIHLIQGHHTERQSFTWFIFWRRLVIWAFISSLIPARVSNATVMLTSQDCGTRHLRLWILAPLSHKVVGSFSMQDAQSLGPPNFNPKLHSPPPKLSTLQCHKLWGTSFLSWDYCRKWGIEVSRFFALNLMCIARFLKTTLAPSNWQGFPSSNLRPSTSMFVTIIFVNMWERVSLRSSLSQTFVTKLFSPSPSLYVRQVTFTSNQSEVVLCTEYFGTYF